MQIVLHGLLSHLFEKKVEVDSKIEKSLVADFLNSKHRNFKASLKKMAKEGNFYEIIESSGDLHIVPMIGGSIGAVTGLGSSSVGKFVMGAVTNVSIGGIIQLITPGDEDAFEGIEDAVVLQSTRFQGLQNVAGQGDKVPVGYGRLKIGSQIINQYSENINVNNSDNISEIKDVFGEENYETLPNGVGLDGDEYLNVVDDVIVSSPDGYDDDNSYQSTDGSNIDGQVSDVTDLDSGLPVITSSTQVQGLEVNGSINYTITATRNPTSFSATGPLDENDNPTSLPNGLLINTDTGLISGSLSVGGTYRILVSATNQFGTSSPIQITLVVGASLITSSNTINTIKGEQLTYLITSNMSPSATTFSVENLPDGLSLNSSTGLITGAIEVVGTFSIIVGASNSTGVNGSLIITINSVNLITSATEITGTIDSPFTYTITTVDNKADTFDATNLPAGLLIDTSTGVISGTPTVEEEQREITLSASRSASPGISVQQQILTISIRFVAAPFITSSLENQAVTVGTNFNYQITAINGPTIFEAVGLPPELTLSNTGLISGTLTEASQSFNISFRAGNNLGFSQFRGFTINTVAPSPSVITSSLATQTISIGDFFTYQITASESPTSFLAVFDPNTSLTLNSSTGLISGAPNIVGQFDIVIAAVNAGGQGEFSTFTLVVEDNFITSPGQANATVGEPFSYTITTVNNSGIVFGFSGTLPPGISKSSFNGVLSGIPTQAGVFELIITAASFTEFGSKELTIIVTGLPTPPVITSPASGFVSTAAKGGAFSIQVQATNNPTTFQATGLPPGLSINGSTGLISGTPNTEGNFSVSLKASNSDGFGESVIFTIDVVETPGITSSLNAITSTVNTAFTYIITASNSPLQFNASNLPRGLAINRNNGLIQGTFTESGTFEVALSASNSVGLGPSSTLTMTIDGVAPQLMVNAGIQGTTYFTQVGQPFPSISQSTGPSGGVKFLAFNDPTSFAAVGLPPGLQIQESNTSATIVMGTVFGTATLAGQYGVFIRATNSFGNDDATINITVLP